MPGTDAVKLAIAAGAALHRLRRGNAVVGDFREELEGLLAGVIAAGAGRPQSVRLDTDPCALIDALVVLCRSAGMSGADMATRFNDAIERFS